MIGIVLKKVVTTHGKEGGIGERERRDMRGWREGGRKEWGKGVRKRTEGDGRD